MKSPWKFLVELTSRGRAAERQVSSPAIEPAKSDVPSPMPAIEVLPPAVPTDGVADVLAQTAGGVVSDAHTSDNVVEADRVPAAPLEGARSDDPGSLPERAASDERPRAKPRRPRGNNSSVRNVAVTAAVKYADDGPDNQLPPMSFLAEVAALDEEIEQLRRQLAEKLLLQNAQLVKLLERY